MGMYTGLRFKGYVKEKFRNDFRQIAISGEWEKHNDPVFKQFGEYGRASFIPCGALYYMPSRWEDEINERVKAEGFDNSYNEETGYWTFACSLKNYENEIQAFLSIAPYFIESVEHIEVLYEESNESDLYIMIGDQIVKSGEISYRDY